MSYVEDGLAEHIGVVSEFLAVQVDGGEGVDAVEDETQTLVESRGDFRAIEGDAVPPLSILDPGAFLFVTVVERVLDAPSGEKCGVNVAWHGDGDPAFLLETFPENPGPDPLTRREAP